MKPAPHSRALAYDAQLIDAAGRLRLLIAGGESTMDSGLNRLAPDHPRFVSGLALVALSLHLRNPRVGAFGLM